ncbi:MAG: hypothetical protein JNK82_27815 [Myxococcaceae bacterium]|nr:hypothetical protein [Myxococcaceae bacterium]
MLIGLALLALLSMPEGADYEAPSEALKGPSSSRLALPVSVRFDETMTDDVSKLVKQSTGSAAPGHATREPVWAVARYAPSVARRHFEQAAWGGADKKPERSVVVKSVGCSWREGPHYECKVVVDRYEGARRLGQATGTGYGYADRTEERTGAAWAGPFGAGVRAEADQPKPEKDGVVIRHATVAALDQALYQLAAVWAGEQQAAELMKKARGGK